MVARELKASFGQLSSCGWMKLSKEGKTFKLAGEDQECFFKELGKDNKDGKNLSG